MRTLSSGLLAAQRASSGTPAVSIAIGGSSYSNRKKQLIHTERPYGGLATILLDNSDNGITADLRGCKVVIGYGFNGSGESKAASLWVLTQTSLSREGQLLTQLQCIDIWQKLNLLQIIGGGGVELDGTITGTFEPGMKVTGQTSGAKATVLGSGTDYIWVSNVAKGPFVSGETVQADLYSTTKITLTAVKDISGGSSPNWAGDKTILQIIQQLCAGVVDVVLDSSDGIVDVTKPTYSTDTGARVLDVIEDMMNYTKCGIRAGNDDKLHIFDISSVPGSPDYSYDSDHCFYSDLRDVTMILPNKVIVVNAEQVGTGVTPFYGVAEDSDAIAQFGLTVPQLVFADVQSDADAAQLAASRLSRIQKEAIKGTVGAPMNCGEELFDYVRITDNRANIDYYGWVGSLERRWEEGMYLLTIGLGGLSGAAGLPPDTEYPLPNIAQPPIPPVAQFAPGIAQSPTLGAYIAPIQITSVDQTHVTWTAGVVTLADGRTQSILAGSLTLTGTHYLFFIIGNNVLQNTTSASQVTGLDRGLVAVVSKGSTSAQKAYALNPFTDSILINTDKVMDGLVTELKLANEAVTNSKIKSIAAEKISAGNIAAARMSAGVLTALKANVDTLDAISVNCGTLTGGILNGVVGYFGAGKVICDIYGILIKGSLLKLTDANGAHSGTMYIDTDGHLRLDAAGWDSGVVVYKMIVELFEAIGYVDVTQGDGLYPPQKATQPFGSDGNLVYDPSDGYLKYYSLHDKQWFRIQRTGGWG